MAQALDDVLIGRDRFARLLEESLFLLFFPQSIECDYVWQLENQALDPLARSKLADWLDICSREDKEQIMRYVYESMDTELKQLLDRLLSGQYTPMQKRRLLSVSCLVGLSAYMIAAEEEIGGIIRDLLPGQMKSIYEVARGEGKQRAISYWSVESGRLQVAPYEEIPIYRLFIGLRHDEEQEMVINERHRDIQNRGLYYRTAHSVVKRIIEDGVFAQSFYETGCSTQSELLRHRIGRLSDEETDQLVRYNRAMRYLDMNEAADFIVGLLDPFYRKILVKVEEKQVVQLRYRRQLSMAVVLGATVYMERTGEVYHREVEARLREFGQICKKILHKKMKLCAWTIGVMVDRVLWPLDSFERLPIYGPVGDE